MHRLIPLFPLIALLPACRQFTGAMKCGTYETHSGYEEIEADGTVQDLDDDDWRERCGADYGTFGSVAHLEEHGTIFFVFTHRDNDLSFESWDFFMEIDFVKESLSVGNELDIIQGDAGLTAITWVPYWEGTIEVLDEREPDAECTPFRRQDFRLDWDLTWAGQEPADGNEWYTATGRDWVGFDIEGDSLSEGCQ